MRARHGISEAGEPPWRRFRVGLPSTTPNWAEPGCQRLTEVSHVAHLEAAYRVIVDGRIRSRLISDESVLNHERMLVTWLSPNIWNPGFRYGSIRFVFDWPRLIDGHRAYWVESIAYGVPACRILLTTNDYSNHRALIPYDPTAGDGPWWHDQASAMHYWNGNYCLEFMVEHDIEVSALEDLDFVNHHRHQCSLDPRNCSERGMDYVEAATLFLARLAASGASLPASICEKRNSRCRDFTGQIAPFVTQGIARLAGNFEGELTAADPSSSTFARALLNAYSNPMLHGDIPHLAGVFRSRDDLRACCSALIRGLLLPEAGS